MPPLRQEKGPIQPHLQGMWPLGSPPFGSQYLPTAGGPPGSATSSHKTQYRTVVKRANMGKLKQKEQASEGDVTTKNAENARSQPLEFALKPACNTEKSYPSLAPPKGSGS